MAFVEGVANSYADLLTAIETAMLANGWTKSGAVLHADGCFVELAAVGTTLTLRGGAGLTGSNALQDPGPNVVRIGNAGTIMQMVFPAVYHIALHASPREVYLHVKYNVNDWQWLAFGASVISVPGTGAWYSGSFSSVTQLGVHIGISGGNSGAAGYGSLGLFWGSGALTGLGGNSFLHAEIDGVSWATASGGAFVNGSLQMPSIAGGLIDRVPSSFNGASLLVPCAVWILRPGNTVTLVGEFSHSRMIRIDNYSPGEVISYGGDRWRVYPFFRKNAAARDGGTINGPTAHTGTMGMAVRYDGP